MVQSYTNVAGSGFREDYIDVVTDIPPAGLTAQRVVNGDTTSNTYFFGGNGTYFRFYFSGDSVLITEAKFYQSSNASHGIWQWQGSDDGSTWTNIGSSFNWGNNVTTQTQTELNGNTTKYKYYQLSKISGSPSGGPYVRQFEFKVDDESDLTSSFIHGQSRGDRKTAGPNQISVVMNPVPGGNSASNLVNGTLAVSGDAPFFAGSSSTQKVTFDFGAPVIVTGYKCVNSGTTANGTFKLQGSSDNFASDVNDVGTGTALGGALRSYNLTALANSTAYRYYRWSQTAGTTDSGPFLIEALFRIGVATGVSVSPDTGALELTGYAPTVRFNRRADPGGGTLEWTGYAPTLASNRYAYPGAGALEWTGYAPAALKGYVRAQPGEGYLEWTGYEPTLRITARVAPGAGILEWEGYAPFINFATVTSQMALLALGSIPVQARVSQQAVMAIGQIIPSVRASAQAFLALGEVIPSNQVSQMALLILAESQPCSTTRAQLWRITRRDGVELGFTSHDRDIEIDGFTFHTCDSLQSSASESASTLGSVGNIELEGVISSTLITEADLYGGLYDDAQVTVDLYSWGDTGDTIKRLAAGWTGELSQGDSGFNMEVLGPGIRLGQQAVVQDYTPGCRWVFGSSQCGVDIEERALAGVVTSALSRDGFSSTVELGSLESTWENGRIIWETGANTGLVNEVKTVDFGSEALVTLWALTSFVPQPGDTFRLLPGCDKAKEGGCTLYNNILNFGGFPDVPGMDDILDTPDAQY